MRGDPGRAGVGRAGVPGEPGVGRAGVPGRAGVGRPGVPDERREIRERHEFHDRSEYREYNEFGEYQEFREDRFEFVVGATLTVAIFRSLTCTQTKVIVNGVVFYSCGGHWYNPVYQGPQVTYVIVNTPPGY